MIGRVNNKFLKEGEVNEKAVEKPPKVSIQFRDMFQFWGVMMGINSHVMMDTLREGLDYGGHRYTNADQPEHSNPLYRGAENIILPPNPLEIGPRRREAMSPISTIEGETPHERARRGQAIHELSVQGSKFDLRSENREFSKHEITESRKTEQTN